MAKDRQDRDWPWWKRGLLALGAMVTAPFVLLLAVPALIVVVVPFMIIGTRRDRAEVCRMKEAGRTVAWHDAVGSVEAGNGTLVAELLLPGGPGRIWWFRGALAPDCPLARYGDVLSTEGIINSIEARDMSKAWCKEHLAPHGADMLLVTDMPWRWRRQLRRISGEVRAIWTYDLKACMQSDAEQHPPA